MTAQQLREKLYLAIEYTEMLKAMEHALPEEKRIGENIIALIDIVCSQREALEILKPTKPFAHHADECYSIVRDTSDKHCNCGYAIVENTLAATDAKLKAMGVV